MALRSAVASRLQKGDTVAIAEINNYEARRELLRKGATAQLARLDSLIESSRYYPIDTDLMRAAPALWASMRRSGRIGAPDAGLDGDVILAAQAQRISDHLVITDNTRHFTGLCRTQTTSEFQSG
jgi:predicted nucleic acid-binding protein